MNYRWVRVVRATILTITLGTALCILLSFRPVPSNVAVTALAVYCLIGSIFIAGSYYTGKR